MVIFETNSIDKSLTKMEVEWSVCSHLQSTISKSLTVSIMQEKNEGHKKNYPTNKKKAYSSIINCRKIIRTAGKRAYHPLQENEEIVSKNIF